LLPSSCRKSGKVYLIVLLIDERPEEVTDMQRTGPGAHLAERQNQRHPNSTGARVDGRGSG
jgi:transcription termination factor Rho